MELWMYTQILSLNFLTQGTSKDGTSIERDFNDNPILVVLYKLNTPYDYCVVSLEACILDSKSTCIASGPYSLENIDASTRWSFSMPYGGTIIVSDKEVLYYTQQGKVAELSISCEPLTCVCRIAAAEFLVQDESGNMYHLDYIPSANPIKFNPLEYRSSKGGNLCLSTGFSLVDLENKGLLLLLCKYTSSTILQITRAKKPTSVQERVHIQT
jgi:hypothetical protein